MVELNSREDADRLGISVIFQELSLIPTLTVAQNILLNKEPAVGGVIKKKQMKKYVEELIARYRFPIEPGAVVETLTLAQRQMVEILKALATNASLIIMDEPTSSLSAAESKLLFQVINLLRDNGVGIVYISHRLEEVFNLSDRITVLRDGKLVDTIEHENFNPGEIVRMMIGKKLSDATASNKLHTSAQPVILETKNLTRLGYYEGVNLQIRRGEVVVLTGLVGSGRTEVLRGIFGADPIDSGEIYFEGKVVRKKHSVGSMIAKGFGLIPEDRRSQGYSPLMSVTRNVAITNYDTLSVRGILVKQKEEKAFGENTVGLVDLRPANPDVEVGNLSGGNQQKVVLGKWLPRKLKVILIDEPTVGIDIGAKDEIYKFIEELAHEGVAVLLVSSDVAEVLRVAHRIIVMRDGRIIREFQSGIVTQEDVLLASSGLNLGKGESDNA